MAPPSIRLLSTFTKDEREKIISEAYCFFPELFSNSSKKYNRYVLWLITDKNIATGSARDGFSSGGKVGFKLKSGIIVRVPAAVGRLVKYSTMVADVIRNTPPGILKERWCVSDIAEDRIQQWIDIVVPVIAESGKVESQVIEEVLNQVMFEA